MQPLFSIGSTALIGTNKTGSVPRNSDGSFRMILGALNFKNAKGEIYTKASGEAILREGTGLRRRIENSQCRGEYGHPKPTPGMTDLQYLTRICQIEETKVCHLHKEVWLETLEYQGQKVLSFMGDIEPEGPYGPTLEEQLLKPSSNVAFSIRSITNDAMVRGINNKSLVEVAAWDYVNEPGLSIATKYNNPALESMMPNIALSSDTIRMMVDDNNSPFVSNESRDMLKSILAQIDRRSIKSYGSLPPSANW